MLWFASRLGIRFDTAAIIYHAGVDFVQLDCG